MSKIISLSKSIARKNLFFPLVIDFPVGFSLSLYEYLTSLLLHIFYWKFLQSHSWIFYFLFHYPTTCVIFFIIVNRGCINSQFSNIIYFLCPICWLNISPEWFMVALRLTSLFVFFFCLSIFIKIAIHLTADVVYWWWGSKMVVILNL